MARPRKVPDAPTVPGSHTGTPIPAAVIADNFTVKSWVPSEVTEEVIAVNPVQTGPAGFVCKLDALWTTRLERLAKAAGHDPEGFIRLLLTRAWTSAPNGVRSS